MKSCNIDDYILYILKIAIVTSESSSGQLFRVKLLCANLGCKHDVKESKQLSMPSHLKSGGPQIELKVCDTNKLSSLEATTRGVL